MWEQIDGTRVPAFAELAFRGEPFFLKTTAAGGRFGEGGDSGDEGDDGSIGSDVSGSDIVGL